MQEPCLQYNNNYLRRISDIELQHECHTASSIPPTVEGAVFCQFAYAAWWQAIYPPALGKNSVKNLSKSGSQVSFWWAMAILVEPWRGHFWQSRRCFYPKIFWYTLRQSIVGLHLVFHKSSENNPFNTTRARITAKLQNLGNCLEFKIQTKTTPALPRKIDPCMSMYLPLTDSQKKIWHLANHGSPLWEEII